MMIRNNNKDVKNTKETNNIKDTNTKEFIVVKDSGLYTEEIYYAGDSELEAFRGYKIVYKIILKSRKLILRLLFFL